MNINEDMFIAYLTNSRYTQVHDSFMKMFKGNGTDAFLLSNTISFYYMLKENKPEKLVDGFFYRTVSDIEEKFAINAYHQRESFRRMSEIGVITIIYSGPHALRRIKINFDKLYELFSIDNNIIIIPKEKKSLRFSSGLKKEVQLEFYKTLNDFIKNESFEDYIHHGKGNIKRDLAEFLYAFNVKYNNFEWTPKQFGIVRNYWNQVYSNKKFDYRSLLDFVGPINMDNVLYEFLHYDSTRVENSPSLKMNVNEFLLRSYNE